MHLHKQQMNTSYIVDDFSHGPDGLLPYYVGPYEISFIFSQIPFFFHLNQFFPFNFSGFRFFSSSF